MCSFEVRDNKSPSDKGSIKDQGHRYIINPSLVIPRISNLEDDFLSPRKLQDLTGVEDLHDVEFLEMKVNTENMSLGDFGVFLPKLSELRLNGSYIPSLRDLGTSLWNVRVLWLPQSGLQSLDGLVSMTSLKELYLAYNDVEDISACAMLESLEILDLEGNMISDITMVYYLSMCPSLSRLTLQANPLCNQRNYVQPETYRKRIFEIISHLQFLDDLAENFEEKIAGGDTQEMQEDFRNNSYTALEFQDHWSFINSVLIESGLLVDQQEGCYHSLNDNRSLSNSTCSNVSRPNTSMRPFSAQRSIISSALGRPLSSRTTQRMASAKTDHSGQDTEEVYEESALTAGRVVCGSITQSLRRKSEEKVAESLKEIISEHIPSIRTLDIVTAVNEEENSLEQSCDLVLKELQEWRLEYEKTKARVEMQRGPQVLSIDYSDEDIEEVDIPSNIKSPKAKKQTGASLKVLKILKNKTEIKLNPLKNGKLHPERAYTMTSGIPRLPKNIVTQSPHNLPPMSRIRRQLILSGVSSTMPSKPVFKK